MSVLGCGWLVHWWQPPHDAVSMQNCYLIGIGIVSANIQSGASFWVCMLFGHSLAISAKASIDIPSLSLECSSSNNDFKEMSIAYRQNSGS
ncbi:hypothetical protein [Ensifer sp. OTU672]|uniref:hypothetical protein n=1 Tax=Ensifer sp. OTU672 TaxID=3043861 RepID=UPI0013B02201